MATDPMSTQTNNLTNHTLTKHRLQLHVHRQFCLPKQAHKRNHNSHSSKFENARVLPKHNHSLYNTNHHLSAILTKTLQETSYLIVRLVFRPHIKVKRTICTSVSLRASTTLSSGFALLRHSSLSFGSLCTNDAFLHKTPWSVFRDG